jgi:hypothetical protein
MNERIVWEWDIGMRRGIDQIVGERNRRRIEVEKSIV